MAWPRSVVNWKRAWRRRAAGARQRSSTGHGARRPVVDLAASTPEAELAAVVGAHLVGCQAQQHHPAAQPTRLLDPTVELPTDALDDGTDVETSSPVPQVLAAFTVLGFG